MLFWSFSATWQNESEWIIYQVFRWYFNFGLQKHSKYMLLILLVVSQKLLCHFSHLVVLDLGDTNIIRGSTSGPSVSMYEREIVLTRVCTRAPVNGRLLSETYGSLNWIHNQTWGYILFSPLPLPCRLQGTESAIWGMQTQSHFLCLRYFRTAGFHSVPQVSVLIKITVFSLHIWIELLIGLISCF